VRPGTNDPDGRWTTFEEAAPDLGRFARERVDGRVCFLATVRSDGSPRVHPVTPWIADGRLFVRMYPSSPKAADLRRDPRFALHSMMDNDDGIGGELALRGRAVEILDPVVAKAAYERVPRLGEKAYILFELGLDSAMGTRYEGDETIRERWFAPRAQATRPGEPSGAE
jgi:hypothetical protein